ncbi:MAG: glycosyltransferase family 2 protein [Defluviitaleaceae bacterium]|nr:glycosyltransferase family 2 protein [Defluviitaleaceae bacterium]
MLLTISMIVKNEEKRLRDCLEAIKPILDSIDAELIINDTGSTDSTVSIAKEFTSKVLETKWENDFAHARNKTLERARGKWYMYVDADEIYEDVSDIIKFFQSGEYKNFVCATIIQKNVATKNTNEYQIINTRKLFKRSKDLRWTGKIHENLTGAEYVSKQFTHTKSLKSSLLHYGYYFESEEAKLAKSERNLTSMLEMYKNSPHDARLIIHLGQEYTGLGRNDDAIKYYKLGADLYDKKTNDPYYHACMHRLIYEYYFMKDYETVARLSKEYFDTTSIVYANAPDIKCIETMSLIYLKRNDEAIAAGNKTKEYINLKESGKLNPLILSYVSTNLISIADMDAVMAGLATGNHPK